MITVLYVLAGLLLIAVSIPMIQHRVRPNPWYGFRTPKTLGSERVWYDANEFCGRMLLRAGIVTLLGTVLLALIPMSFVARPFADVIVMLVSVLWATAVSFAYLQKL